MHNIFGDMIKNIENLSYVNGEQVALGDRSIELRQSYLRPEESYRKYEKI